MKKLYLLHGPNEVLQKRFLEEILEKFSSMEKETLYIYEKKPEIFENEALSDFLFGEGMVYVFKGWDVVKEYQRQEWEEMLVRVASTDTPHIYILLAETFSKSFLSRIEAFAGIVECKTLYGRDILQFIRESFQKYRLSYEENVLEYLLDISNQSLEEIDRMLAILLPAASERGKITLQLAKDLLVPATNHSIFDLLRGIFTRNHRLALQAFRNLRLEGDSLQHMFAMIYRTTRLLWSFKTRGDLSLEQWAKQESISLFEAKRLQEYNKNLSQKDLSEWFHRLADLEEIAKTTREEIAEILFEAFLVESSPIVLTK